MFFGYLKCAERSGIDMKKSGRLSNLVLQQRAVMVKNVICHRQDGTRSKREKEKSWCLL